MSGERAGQCWSFWRVVSFRSIGGGYGIEGGVEGGGVAPACCAGTATVIKVDTVDAGSRRGVGGDGGVGLGGAAGDDVDGGVDGDFEVAALRRVVRVGVGKAHDDLRDC